MSRAGFDQKLHPYQLQLRTCSILDPSEIQSRNSVTLDFREGKITKYYTDIEKNSTTIKEYIASDDELRLLYNLFTIEAVKKFEAMEERELRQYQTGYYDNAYLRYLLIGADGRVLNGMRSHIFSNDPIIMAIKWLHKTAPFNLEY